MSSARIPGNLGRMWPYHPDLLAKPVPRYTSYPTAAEFSKAVGVCDFEAAVARASGDVSLYIHIPFCDRICWYCGCNTTAANRSERLATYLEALHREIALTGALLPPGAHVRRIAFGGGSPNALAPVDFVRLFDQLALHFALEEPQVSVEVDPRALCDTWGMVLSGIGATHASLGVQTFAPHLQAAIGRVQPEEMIVHATRLLRDAGVTSLNFDIMYGLPGQMLEDLADSLDRTAALAPERIAVFGYAHVPAMFARQKRIDASSLPGAQSRFAMAALAHTRLTDAGYAPVGFDHFALPGDALAKAAISGRLHRNFQGFTEDRAPVLIGLGASAISCFPDLLCQNEKNPGRYRMLLSQGKLPTALGKARSADDCKRGAIIEDLLCRLHARISRPVMEQALGSLAPFLEARLCEYADGVLSIRAEGLPYARGIAACFDEYLTQPPHRFSSAV